MAVSSICRGLEWLGEIAVVQPVGLVLFTRTSGGYRSSARLFPSEFSG